MINILGLIWKLWTNKQKVPWHLVSLVKSPYENIYTRFWASPYIGRSCYMWTYVQIYIFVYIWIYEHLYICIQIMCVCVAITCIPIFIGASLLSPSFIPKQVLSSKAQWRSGCPPLPWPGSRSCWWLLSAESWELLRVLGWWSHKKNHRILAKPQISVSSRVLKEPDRVLNNHNWCILHQSCVVLLLHVSLAQKDPP